MTAPGCCAPRRLHDDARVIESIGFAAGSDGKRTSRFHLFMRWVVVDFFWMPVCLPLVCISYFLLDNLLYHVLSLVWAFLIGPLLGFRFKLGWGCLNRWSRLSARSADGAGKRSRRANARGPSQVAVCAAAVSTAALAPAHERESKRTNAQVRGNY